MARTVTDLMQESATNGENHSQFHKRYCEWWGNRLGREPLQFKPFMEKYGIEYAGLITETPAPEQPKRGRGRPKGSKNKPKGANPDGRGSVAVTYITAGDAWAKLGSDAQYEPKDKDKPANSAQLYRMNMLGLLV